MASMDQFLIVPERPQTETLRVPVLKVCDGDGFLTRTRHPVSGEERDASIRFGFIDAPEMAQPGGQEAKNFLTSLIGGQWVDLAILTKMDTGGITDRHGRIVCVPYLTLDHTVSATTGPQGPVGKLWRPITLTRNIELEMVLNGWAWVLDRYEPDQRYHDALDEARHHRRGIWARDGNMHPWEFKKRMYRERNGRRCSPVQPDLFADPSPTSLQRST